MQIFFTLLIACTLLLGLGTPTAAQQLANDGFHRRNGQMHVLRNGQLRPMTRDSRLPTGTVVTKDGFLVSSNGTRTELLEGQACDLKGRVVAVRTGANGALALGAPLPGRGATFGNPVAARRSAFEEFLSGPRKEDERRGEDEDEDRQERAEEARKQGDKEEKWLREQVMRYQEHGRGRGKKWKDKRKRGKKGDD